jgi:hypothetical protein
MTPPPEQQTSYLRITNWDRWQSYRKDRGQPPWIKIHRCVMRNPEWAGLTDSERGQLVCMWLLAADKDGQIPVSATVIKKLCFLTEEPDLNKFMDLGFIENGWRQDDANMTPTWRQDDANMTPQSRIDKNREDKEKRRFIREKSELPKKVTKPTKNKTPLPKNYQPTEQHTDYAKTKGMTDKTIADEFEAFCIHHRKVGNKYVDWYAAWQTWVRNHFKFKKRDEGSDIDDAFARVRARYEASGEQV